MTDPRKELQLDDFFAAARDDAPVPSGDFMLEMQALALAEQPQRRAEEPRRGALSQIWAFLGGWPAVAGLAATAVTGVWIGSVPPEAMSSSLDALLSGQTGVFDTTDSYADPLSGFEFAMVEG